MLSDLHPRYGECIVLPQPGVRNSLTDVSRLLVGNAEDASVRTGVTVVGFDKAMRCVVDVRGGGPATRETNAVGSDATLGVAHAITLSGGSVFGLAAADKIASILSSRKIGVALTQDTPTVPIVPAASLYDLNNGGDKNWGEAPPYRALVREAFSNLSADFSVGSFGAGYGAIAGRYLGGLGSASLNMGDDGVVASLIAVNSIGSPVMPQGDCFWSWPFEFENEFGGLKPSPNAAVREPLPSDIKGRVLPGQATCIGVVATSMPLDRASLMRVAIMSQDGLARAIRPSHAPFDGDTIFAICPDEDAIATPDDVMRIGSAAADCVARAVARGVWSATASTETATAFSALQS